MVTHYSKGFYIKNPVGNNEFSFDKRKTKEIFVSCFSEKDNLEIMQGNKPAFIEVENQVEKIHFGLDEFIMMSLGDKNIYVFDNHNHGFYVILKEAFCQQIPLGLPIIHFDQHKDLRRPSLLFREMDSEEIKIREFLMDIYGDSGWNKKELTELDKAYYYTNKVLNVGNFLVPLVEEGLVSEIIIIDSTYQLNQVKTWQKKFPRYILDIDLDFFSEDMDYIPYERKIQSIKSLINQASLITVCTSPFFVNFHRAKKALMDIFE